MSSSATLSTAEETPITLTRLDVTVQDLDGPGATLVVENGLHYTHVGNIVTPEPDYNGLLAVRVVVQDGAGGTSLPLDLPVMVTPVNDAPVITAQLPLVVNEDGARELLLSDLLQVVRAR